MKTSEKTLRNLYNIGDKKVREELEKEFPSIFKQQTLLQQAIDYLTEQDKEVIKLRKLEKLEDIDNILAEQKLVVIIRWKNKKEALDWSDSNQYKYYPWFYLDDFRLSDVYCSYSNFNCSARLCFKNKSDAEEMSKNEEMLSYYKLYMTEL